MPCLSLQEEQLSGRQWLGWGMFALLLTSYSLKTVVRNRDWANGVHYPQVTGQISFL